jgi:hypothetical protein
LKDLKKEGKAKEQIRTEESFKVLINSSYGTLGCG